MLHHKPLHNYSACKIINCGQIGLNVGMQSLMKKVSVYCEFTIEMLLKILIAQTKHDGARQTFQVIYFPQGSVREWLSDSCWLINYRLAIAVKNKSSPVIVLSTDYQPVGNNLKRCLRTVAD